MQQFDLFLDSNDVGLRNAAIDALRQNDSGALRQAINRLRGDYPDDYSLADLDILCAGLRVLEAPAISVQTLADQVTHLDTVLSLPLQGILGTNAAAHWIAKACARLADKAHTTPFHRPLAHAHAASLFLRAGDLAAAKTAVERIPSWRNIPEPLAWMTEIALREETPDTYLPLLAELAWIAPINVDAVIRRAAPASIQRPYQIFLREAEAEGETHEACWFPAWLLTEQSNLARQLRTAHTNASRPARCFALLIDLLTGERHGLSQITIDKRAQLNQLSPFLFSRFMALR